MAVLAVDAGGTSIKLAVVQEGAVLGQSSLPAHSDDGLEPRLPLIADALRQLIPPGVEVEGLGMAFPSLIDGDHVVGDVGKYRDAERLDLKAWVLKEFRAPFAIENDARMAAIGEWRCGAGKGSSDVVMVTLGTGIGTGVIMGGQVVRGRHGSAGILGGHMTARVGGRPCPCGNVGCWETEASTAALRELTSEVLDGPLDYARVFAEAERGSAWAIELRDRSLAVWSSLAVSLIHAYDPEVLVFGGGVMASGEATLGPIRDHVRRHAWTPWGQVRVVASELGNRAALLACEWLVRNRLSGDSSPA